MRILITGITGLLGGSLYNTARIEHKLCGLYYPERDLQVAFDVPVFPVNITEKEMMTRIIKDFKPDVIIHTAGVGNVDYAEQNKEDTHGINIGGTRTVIDLCEQNNIRLIYISSNAVFNGNDPLYSETDSISPINYYGKLKVEAEELVRSSKTDWAIVRPILMYGWPYPGERSNHVVSWVSTLRSCKPIKVVDNVYSKPLYSYSCAEVIWAIIDQKKKGLYHVAGLDHISLYEFALLTANVFQLDEKLITPVPDTYFPELAPRPRDTSFNTEKMERELGLRPMSVREGLLHMKKIEENRKLI
jgi:dTDP-4-dehydrorhamnose reductase